MHELMQLGYVGGFDFALMASQLLGVSLRATRDTTKVMLGVSLRARYDTTLVYMYIIVIMCLVSYFRHEVNRSSTNLIQTLSASARCHEQRRELYGHLVEKYDCVSLPEGKAGRLLKIEPPNRFVFYCRLPIFLSLRILHAHFFQLLCLGFVASKQPDPAPLHLIRGFAKNFFSKNPRLLWKWVGGSRSHSDFFFFENCPKIALN